jgi:hypothetical protein
VSIATIVLCPPLPGASASYDASEVADALIEDARLSGTTVLSPTIPDSAPDDDARTARAHWVAHLAMHLAMTGAAAPLLVVVEGTSGSLAPAVGFSQKASRRAVEGYVLVDAATPPIESSAGDWPDAPVHYLASAASDPLEVNQARLRGWTVHEIADLEPATLADAVATIASP